MTEKNRTIRQWQQIFSDAANRKFPNNKEWSSKDRVLSILRQLADVGGGLQKEEGIFPVDKHGYDDPDHRIAATIVDLLILAEERNIELEAEFEKALKWLKSK